MLKIIKNILCAERSFNNGLEEDYQDIYKANKINWQKEHL